MTAEPPPGLRAVAPAHRQPITTRWEPQHQFVGALLWHDATNAAALLQLVPASTLTDPLTRWAGELIADLVADGRNPNPPAVLHRARTQPARQALYPDRAPTARNYHRFATHLAELFTRVVDPGGAVDLAQDVLDDAYRAAVGAAGHRMQDLAVTATSANELADALDVVRTELDELRRRRTNLRRHRAMAARVGVQADMGNRTRPSRTG